MSKKTLTEEQKNILFKEETEPPGSSSLNYEKREGDYNCASCGTKLLSPIKNMRVEVVGHLFLKHYQTFLIQK